MMFRDFVTYRIVRDKCVRDCNYTDDELCDWRKTKCKWINDLDFIRETFSEWLDNVDTKLSKDDYKNMAAAMDKKQQDRGYEYFWLKDLSMFNDTAEAFNYWVDANKSIFTADDYDTMADAI